MSWLSDTWDANNELILDVWVYKPYLVGWVVIAFSHVFIFGTLEAGGILDQGSPEKQKHDKMIGTLINLVVIPILFIAPVVFFSLAVAIWWGYYIYRLIIPPPERLRKIINHLVCRVLVVYTALVMQGYVHQRPRFLMGLHWFYFEQRGMSARINESYPSVREHMVDYLRSPITQERINAFNFLESVDFGKAKKFDNPDILEAIFERFEKETDPEVFGLCKNVLYTLQQEKRLTPEQIRRLGELKRAGVADRFTPKSPTPTP